jgi:hypothetical protein
VKKVQAKSQIPHPASAELRVRSNTCDWFKEDLLLVAIWASTARVVRAFFHSF